MSVILELAPEQEAQLRGRAERHGQTLNGYLQSLASLFSDSDAALRMATALYNRRQISQGQAAALAGVSRSDFVDALGRAGVPVLQYSAEEAIAEARRK